MIREPGAKQSRMYAGNGKTTRLRVHAVYYEDSEHARLSSWVTELAEQNPGYTFFLREIKKNRPNTEAPRAAASSTQNVR
jgi:hypothetical protein